MAGPWEDYTAPVATPTPLPADGPWSDYGGQAAPTAPASSAEFKAGLHAILAAPDFTPDKAAAYIAQNHRSATGSTNDALKWVVQHPGHGGEVGIQDFGPQPTQQPNAAPQQPPQQTTAMAAPDSGFTSSLRGVASGVLGGFGEKAGAGIDAVLPEMPGTQSIWGGHSITDAYQHNLAGQQAQSQADENAHPWLSGIGTVAGAIASPISRIGAGLELAEGAPMLARAGAAVLPDAVYGASYGAGQSQAPTWGGEALNAAEGAGGAILGHGIGAGALKGAGAVATGVTDAGKQALHAAGVQFTPGQALGGLAQGFERLATSMPLMGNQIKQRLAESGQGWWNATLNNSLHEIDQKLPDGLTGADAVNYGQRAFDKAYSDARSGMSLAATPEFNQGLEALKNRIFDGGANSLSTPYADKFANVLQNTVVRRLENGPVNGNVYKTIVSELAKVAKNYGSGNNPAEAREYAEAVQALSGLVDKAARQVSPAQAVAKMDAADRGYAQWALAENAAKRAGGEAGNATPAQYLAAVKQGDNSARNRAFSGGNAFGQDWGQQGVDALGRAVPNSFTADRMLAAKMIGDVGAGTLLGMGASHVGAPGLGAGLSLGLPAADAAGSLLYSKPVNAFANKLLFDRGPSAAKVGQKLNAFAAPVGKALGATGATLAIQHATP